MVTVGEWKGKGTLFLGLARSKKLIKFLAPESVRQLNSKEPILLFPLIAVTHTLILIVL